eukprot:1971190-Rhodomonas_salina.1
MLYDSFGDDRELLIRDAYILTHPPLPRIFWLDRAGLLRREVAWWQQQHGIEVRWVQTVKG